MEKMIEKCPVCGLSYTGDASLLPDQIRLIHNQAVKEIGTAFVRSPLSEQQAFLKGMRVLVGEEKWQTSVFPIELIIHRAAIVGKTPQEILEQELLRKFSRKSFDFFQENNED